MDRINEEQWRQVPNYPYQASTWGRLRNTKFNIVQPGKTKVAGLQYRLSNMHNKAYPIKLFVSASRLIAGIWMDQIEGGHLVFPFYNLSKPWEFPARFHVKHRDGNFSNNYIENLYIEEV